MTPYEKGIEAAARAVQHAYNEIGVDWQDDPDKTYYRGAAATAVSAFLSVQPTLVELCTVHWSRKAWDYDGTELNTCVERFTDNHEKPGPCEFADCRIIEQRRVSDPECDKQAALCRHGYQKPHALPASEAAGGVVTTCQGGG